MALYTTQAPDGNSFVPLENWVFDTICSKLGEKQWGTEIQVELGRLKDFCDRLQESFHPGKNMIQAMLPRSERDEDRNILRESFWGRLGWPKEQHSSYTSFSMSWKLISTHPHTGKHSIWRTHAPVSQITLAGDFGFYFLGKGFFIWNTYKALKLKPGKSAGRNPAGRALSGLPTRR